MAKQKPFNNPFGALKVRKEEPPAPAPAKPAAAPPAKKQQKVSAADESAEFLAAMGAFDPVKPVREEAPAPAPPVVHPADDDAESLLELAELVVGDAELEVEQSGERVIAAPKGLDRKLLGRLPPKSKLDIQALEPDAARGALERFVIDAQLRGVRCVRLVTGAAYRAMAVEALSRGKLTRKVLAFSGGADVIDVLLRR